MRSLRLSFVAGLVLLAACQASPPRTVTIIDGDQARYVEGDASSPRAWLASAGITLQPGDQVLVDGYPVSLDAPMPSEARLTLQIRRAVEFTENGKAVRSAAATVGEALREQGFELYAADIIDPPVGTGIQPGMQIKYLPARPLSISVDAKQIQVRSAAGTVGAALADAGFPLIGLDFSVPAEDQTLPADGLIHITRVSEALVLSQESIPYTSTFQTSAEVELGQQRILQLGVDGLAVSRARVRYEDGQEVSRQSESRAVVRQPQERIVARGTKVVVHTAAVDGVQIQYWRAIEMFATAYSPCNSGPDRCWSSTSSGKPVQKGVVGVAYSMYLSMQGQALYIPGYGYASIEDVCGGCVGKPWIDLGYTDEQYAQEGGHWGRYVTVYFLAPAPPTIPDVLQ